MLAWVFGRCRPQFTHGNQAKSAMNEVPGAIFWLRFIDALLESPMEGEDEGGSEHNGIGDFGPAEAFDA